MATPATIIKDNMPTVVLLGRANVGKSTLFNRLTETGKALVSNIPGTTRTSNSGLVLWRGTYIRLIDTGGMDSIAHKEIEFFELEIQEQVKTAIQEADIILFVTDAQLGIFPQEKILAKKLIKEAAGIPVVLVANKADNARAEAQAQSPEWYGLSLGAPFAVSASNGRSLGDLLDMVYEKLKKTGKKPVDILKEEKTANITVSIVGKPNVGKSSLFNKLVGKNRAIVSPAAHTTRESLDLEMLYEDKDGVRYSITFVDTAGLRRKAKVWGMLERGGIGKSIESIEKSDIVLLLIDGSEPISSQDMQIGGMVKNRAKSVILIVNKWDCSNDNSDEFRNEVKRKLYAHFPHLSFAPVLFVSSKTGYRVQTVFPEIVAAARSRETEVPQAVLDSFLERITRKHKPSRGKGTRHPKILGIKQIGSAPAVFELFIKGGTSLHQSYVSFVENQLREEFDFNAMPVIIKLTKMKK